MSARYGAAVVALRHVLVLGWIAAAVVAHLTMPGAGEARAGALGSLVPEDAAALETHRRSAELFAFPVLTNSVVVQRDEDGLSAATQARVVQRARSIVRREYPELLSIPFALPVTNAFGLFPGSAESNTTALTFLYFEPGVGLNARVRLANWFMDIRVDHPEDALVGKTGIVPARVEQSRVISDALPRVQAGTVLLIALVIGLTFRGFAAPLVMLAAVGIAHLVSLRLVAVAAGAFDFAVPQEAEPVMLVLLLGLVTNYSIFLLAGLRHRLHEGEERLAAARRASADTGPIVLIAGLIVAAAAGALVVAELEFFRVFGPALALAVATGVTVALTFVPAALALLGRFAYWPGRLARRESAAAAAPTGRAVARSRAVSAVVAVLAVVALAAAASGLARLELALTPIGSLPDDTEPARAAAAAEAGFAPGILSPTLVLVEGNAIGGQREALVRLQRSLERLPGVAGAIGPADLPREAPLGLVVSERGDAARYVLVLDQPPLASNAIEWLGALRATLPRLLDDAGLDGAEASLGGNTALAAETIDTIVDDLFRISLAVLAVVLVLLVLFLRSLVAPLYLLAAGVLAMAATLGLTVYAVELLFGYTDVTYYVPFMAAVLLVALGSDYNILLVGRVWQEARERPLPEAIAVAAPRAARTISVAAVALASSFGLLALVPLASFREFALAMVIGVALDAFVVRTFLVPALLRLFGEASGWPGGFRSSPAAERV
ncbi:MAG TPA: MMPL family transporter [Gaiellaceae bacterium]|nr:MMPL family transporter [Gaiellaceae bacterium]